MPDKTLPRGCWLSIRSLPHEITEEQVQDWLNTCGIELPLENIAVNKNHLRFAQAIVSLDRQSIADLFRRATLTHKFHGRPLDITFKSEGTVKS